MLFRSAERARLDADLQRSRDLLTQTAPAIVNAKLRSESVVVVAERGVDEATVRSTAQTIRDAGADAPVVVWLEAKWLLDSEARIRDLGKAVGSTETDSAALRAAALARLAVRLRSDDPSKTDDLLVRLASTGFITVESLRSIPLETPLSFPGAAGRALAIVGLGSELGTSQITTAIGTSLAQSGLETVTAELDPNPDDNTKRGSLLGPLIDNAATGATVGTVDTLDLIEGRLATVFALVEAGRGRGVHLGYGPGASAALPAP